MTHLLRLYADNRKVSDRRFSVRNETHGEAEIYLYDAIVDSELEAEFWGGVSPKSFVQSIKDIDADVIHLRVNSPGGSVFAARAMEQALRDHKAKIVAHVDGVAASAASFLVMAADEIVMSPGALMMIHKAWTVAMGNADDLVNTAGLLEKIDSTLVQTYAQRSGMDADKIADMMASETWFTAQEAVDAGFADSISESVKAAQRWNLSAYQKAPAQPEPKPANVAALLRRLDVATI
jgi:ATP-dependent Clp protease protease subunit